MIQNDEEKSWMLPLLELRNALDLKDDRQLRDFRRMSGLVQLFHDRPIPGPYTQAVREDWLRRLLTAQRWVRENGPSYVRDIELVTLAELEEIRRHWVVEKHELEDRVPTIYAEAMGSPYPGRALDDYGAFGPDELALLKQACGADELHYQMTRDLLDISQRFRARARRSGLYEELEEAIRKSFYEDESDAVDRALRQQKARNALGDGTQPMIVDTSAQLSFETLSADSPEVENGGAP